MEIVSNKKLLAKEFFKKVDRDSKVPFYAQIMEQIEEAIYKSILVNGDRLINEFNLAKEFNVSRATVRQAIKELELKGLVKRERGSIGTHISSSKLDSGLMQKVIFFSNELKQKKISYKNKIIEKKIIKPPERIRKKNESRGKRNNKLHREIKNY